LPEHHQPSPGEWQPLTEPFQPPIKACQHLTKRFIGAWKRARIIVDTGGGHGGTPPTPPTPPATPGK
jgi:hypothetical protein